MRYSFESRCRAVAAMVAGLRPGVAAQAVGASRATGYRWRRRYVTAGWVGLQERPSTPKHQPRRLDAAAEAEILAARTHSGAGPVTLGALLGRPASTVGKVLRRLGHSRRRASPDPPSCATSAPPPGSCCTSIPSSWGAAGTSASASPATASSAARAPAGRTCTWPSTTTRGWPTPRCRPSDRQGNALALLDRARA